MGRLPGMIIVGSFFILSSCISGLELGRKPPQKTPEIVSLGKRLYENNCTQCHGSKGEGEGWKAADLKVKPRNFTLPFDQWRVSRGDPRKIFDVLKVGIPDTPWPCSTLQTSSAGLWSIESWSSAREKRSQGYLL